MKIYGKTLKITNATFENNKQGYLEFRKHFDSICNSLGNDLQKWIEFSSEVEQKYGIKFNISLFNSDEEILIEEEGYVEPTPDPMMMYTEELSTFNNIKATHELGLISDEDMEECSEYMKSLYPNGRARMAKLEKPELFEKFRSNR
ncbi:MAG: hypothetical protein ACRC5T_11265 [Cetobacterium sp.]